MSNKSISDIVLDRSLSTYVREEFPTYNNFLKAYLDWLEFSKNPNDIAINLKDYRQVDNTLEEFIDYFHSEVLATIPKNILADRRLLIKYIKNFYLNKGNEASYKLLFFILFGEEIDFYYPKTDVLRASDGKWYEEQIIKVSFDRDVLTYVTGQEITGSTSGAMALVESAISYVERNNTIIELELSNVKGQFVSGENIEFSYTDVDGIEQNSNISTIYKIIDDINIITQGSGYNVDDVVYIKDVSLNTIGTAKVIDTVKGGIQSLIIEQAGTGYNGQIRNIDRFYALPGNWTLNGDFLPNVTADGSGSGDTVNYTQYTFDEIIPNQQQTGIGDRIEIIDSDFSFGTGAFGIINEVDLNGSIQSVILVEEGSGYNIPLASIISDTGTGGEISVVGGGGAISKLSLENFPIVSESDYDSNNDLTITIDATMSGDGNAQIDPLTSVIGIYPGIFLNEDGHLSSSKRLQDNFFYQDYSYVLRVSTAISRWKDIVVQTIHPAGLALFGEVNIVQNISKGNKIFIPETEIEMVSKLNTNGTPGIVDTEILVDGVPIPEDSNGQTVSYPVV